jgi:hypothetical protein
VVFALEYVLAKRNDLAVESLRSATGASSRAESFGSVENAVQFLAQNGVFLQLPKSEYVSRN